MSNLDLFKAYLAAHLRNAPANAWDDLQYLSGAEVVEALWPLNDWFHERIEEISALAYQAEFEADADLAIQRFVEGAGTDAWSSVSPQVLRVLLERHTQAVTLASVNQAEGNPLLPIPRAVPKQAWLGAAMLFLMYQMKLPFPVRS